MLKRTILAATIASAAGTAFAAEETRLFESGAWYVAHVAFDDGTAGCSMVSGRQTEAGETLDSVVFWALDTGLVFHAISAEWNAAPRDVTVHINVDGKQFDGDASVDGHHVIVADLTPEFMSAVVTGHDMTLATEAGRELLTYTLDGTAAAFEALAECWERTAPSASSSADPFGSASLADPF